jgi:hypothetical protein
MSVAPLIAVAAPPANGSSNSSPADVAVAASLPSAVVESVGQQLASLGLAVQPLWLRDALAIEMREGALPQLQAYMRTSGAGGSGGGASSVAPSASLLTSCRDCVWSRALLSSLLRMGARRLPILRTLNTPTLAGTHVLQLLECVDVAHSANQLAEKAQWEDRVWKLLLTDGQQLCAAFERRRCQSLSHAAMKPGVKVRKQEEQMRCKPLLPTSAPVALTRLWLCLPSLPLRLPLSACSWSSATCPCATVCSCWSQAMWRCLEAAVRPTTMRRA